jgi:hypothetical protein
MKKGDRVKMSEKNQNAYDGMEGIVTYVFEDNGFVLDCKTSTLVVPMRNYWGRIKGVWVYLNDKLIYHKSKRERIKVQWFRFLGADM